MIGFVKPPFVPIDLTLVGRAYADASWTAATWRNDASGWNRRRTEIDIAMNGPRMWQVRSALGEKARTSTEPWDRFAAALAYGLYGSKEDATWVLYTLERWKPPVTPEWARLRFLVSNRVMRSPNLIPLGEKLVSKFPEDDRLRQTFIRVAGDRPNADETRDPALREMAVLRKHRPKDVYLDVIEGSVWQRRAMFIVKDRKESIGKARALFTRFLRNAPKDHFFRAGAQKLLGTLSVIEKFKS